MNELASRYANALYSIALEDNKIKVWQEEVKTIYLLLKDNRDFIHVLSSAFLSLKEKEDIIDNTFKNIDKDILSLMKLMVKNHRERYLVDALQAFNSLCNGYRGVKEGLIYSTERLDEKTLNRISQKIGELEKVEVELYNIIDPTLLGGVKVVIDGHIYDGSVRYHLDQLKENLLKGQNYENKRK